MNTQARMEPFVFNQQQQQQQQNKEWAQ